MGTSYDDVPYESYCFPRTHPDHLHTLATLHGLSPCAPASARVLEVGCASGGNLLPMALTLPGARLVGLDNGALHIRKGNRVLSRVKLANVSLHCADLRTFDSDAGPFDYVIAHGVYSWVDADVKAALLARIAAWLAPNGVAFVSHNVLPGHALRQIARDAMLLHAPLHAGLSQRERFARSVEMMDLMVRGSERASQVYQQAMIRQRELVQYHAPWFGLHDVLHEHCDADYFSAFASKLEANGLAYVCDTHPNMLLDGAFDPMVTEAVRAMAGDDRLRRQQYLDFALGRGFRESLVCRAQDVRGAGDLACRARVRDDCFVASPFTADPLAPRRRFLAPPDNVFETDDPVEQRVLLTLGAAWPMLLSFASVCERALDASRAHDAGARASLAETLFRLYRAGCLLVRAREADFVAHVSARPHTPAIVREQAIDSRYAPSMLHDSLPLSDDERAVLRKLDGTRAPAEIAAEMGADPEALLEMLKSFAQRALLIA